MQDSEFEYAELRIHGHGLGRAVRFWSGEGWDVVTAQYPPEVDMGGAMAYAVLRRRRALVRAGDPPGYTRAMVESRGAVQVTRSMADGSWGAQRWVDWMEDGRTRSLEVASVCRCGSETEALAALDLLRLTPEEANIALGGEPGEALERVYKRLRLSVADAEKLVREHVPGWKWEP